MHRKKSSPAEARAVHWALTLGEERQVRDEGAARTAKSQEDDETRTMAASAERWVAIVAGIRQLADAYNTGAGRVVLSVVEQSGQQTVTVAAGCEGTSSLTAVLEGKLICIQARDAGGVPHASEIRLRPDRDDDATAAYVLQNWMQRL
jgi:hypothetical protein